MSTLGTLDTEVGDFLSRASATPGLTHGPSNRGDTGCLTQQGWGWNKIGGGAGYLRRSPSHPCCGGTAGSEKPCLACPTEPRGMSGPKDQAEGGPTTNSQTVASRLDLCALRGRGRTPKKGRAGQIVPRFSTSERKAGTGDRQQATGYRLQAGDNKQQARG